ncbi:MAG: hypothetical protein FWC85_03195 [Elusimicrobia bacterium]|nr:hypothetical protein [Elusimicrobiota bacterium]
MKRFKNILLAFMFIGVFYNAVWAVAPALEFSVDKTSITIGERLTLTIRAVLADGNFIITPRTDVHAGLWRIVNASAAQVSQSPNTFVIEYLLTTFVTSESLLLPAFQIFYSDSAGNISSFFANSQISVYVESLILNDENFEGIRGAKPMQTLATPTWIVMLLTLFTALFMFFVVWPFSKFLYKRYIFKPKPANPQEDARKAINMLLLETVGDDDAHALFRAIDSGARNINYSTYYFRLSEILRNYIDAKYKTGTILLGGDILYKEVEKIIDANLNTEGNTAQVKQSVVDFITVSEDVKYAGTIPDAQAAKNAFNTVKALVEKL